MYLYVDLFCKLKHFYLNLFLTPIVWDFLLDPKIFLRDQRNCLYHNFLVSKFKTQHLFYAKFFFDPTFWAKILFWPNTLFDTNSAFFYGHPVGKKNWVEKIRLQKIWSKWNVSPNKFLVQQILGQKNLVQKN